jgi:hypothetical protein
MSGWTCHIIVMRPLLWNVIQKDLSLSVVWILPLLSYGEKWQVIENTTMTVPYVFTKLGMKLLFTTGAYKSMSWCNKHTHTYFTNNGSKVPEPWSPRWVKHELRKRNNGLPPNDPNHDEKPLADAERPLCKFDFECQSHMSIYYDSTTGGISLSHCPPVRSIGVGTKRSNER